MSLNRSLKTSGNLSGKRSVMKRAERIEKLTNDQKFAKGDKIILEVVNAGALDKKDFKFSKKSKNKSMAPEAGPSSRSAPPTPRPSPS